MFLCSHVDAKDLLKLEAVAGSKLQRIHIEGYVEAKPEDVWNVLTNFESYPEFMPKVTATRIVSENASSKTYFAHVSMPWPIDDIEYECEAKLEKDSMKMPFALIEGTGKGVKSFKGEWTLLPEGEGTRASYTLFVEPTRAYPAWVVNLGTKSTIGKTFTSLRKHLKKIKK